MVVIEDFGLSYCLHETEGGQTLIIGAMDVQSLLLDVVYHRKPIDTPNTESEGAGKGVGSNEVRMTLP